MLELIAAVPLAIFVSPEIDRCFDMTTVAPAIITALAEGEDIEPYFALCHSGIGATLEGSEIATETDVLRAVFATMTAYASRPYGQSDAVTINEMVLAEELDCDNKVALAVLIYRALGGTSPARIVGWYSEEMGVGNHAQIFLEAETALMLDPTVGLIAVAEFDEIASGRAIDRDHLIDFYWGDEIRSYRDRVFNAVWNGHYKPSHLMYWFADLESYRNAGGSSTWETPGAFTLAERHRQQRNSYRAVSATDVPHSGDFRNWQVRRGAVIQIRPLSADMLILNASGQVFRTMTDFEINSGDVVQATVTLRADSPTRVAFQLLRWCSTTPSEVQSAILPVGPESTRFEISMEFEHSHDCFRVQLIGLDEATAVYAWAPRLRLNGETLDDS